MAPYTESDYDKMRREWDEPWELGYEPLSEWKPDYFKDHDRDLFHEMEHQNLDPINSHPDVIRKFAVDNGYSASEADDLIKENES